MKKALLIAFASLVSATAGASALYQGRITANRDCVGDLRKGTDSNGALTCRALALPEDRRCLMTVEGNFQSIRIQAMGDLGTMKNATGGYGYYYFNAGKNDNRMVKIKLNQPLDPVSFEARRDYSVSKSDMLTYSFKGVICSDLKRLR